MSYKWKKNIYIFQKNFLFTVKARCFSCHWISTRLSLILFSFQVAEGGKHPILNPIFPLSLTTSDLKSQRKSFWEMKQEARYSMTFLLYFTDACTQTFMKRQAHKASKHHTLSDVAADLYTSSGDRPLTREWPRSTVPHLLFHQQSIAAIDLGL